LAIWKQDQGFVTLWVAKHMFKKKLSYIGFKGTGLQARDIIHIQDVCEIIFKQIKKINKISNQTFNIGGGPKIILI
jgi:CDP-paratose 2-epimerase